MTNLFYTILNRLGNYIEFEYTRNTSNGEVNIANIYYTKHISKSKTDYKFKVSFEYSDLGSPSLYSRAYFSYGNNPGYIENTKKLDRIKVIYGTSVIKRYELSYLQQADFNNYLLKDVKEYGTDNNSHFESSSFVYVFNVAMFKYLSKINMHSNSYDEFFKTLNYFPIQIEGKSKVEIIHDVKVSGGMGPAGKKLRIGNDDIPLTLRYEDIKIADFNADNKDELFVFSNDYLFDIKIIKNSSGAYSFTVNQWGTRVESDNHHIVGDFDGDGINDLLFKDVTNDKYRVFFGNTDLSFSRRIDVQIPINKDHEILTGDFDGDGKTDLLVIGSFGNIYSMNSNNTGFQGVGNNIQSLVKGLNLQTGDFNGDGKTDLVFPFNDSWNPGDTVIGALDKFMFYFFAGNGTYHNESFACEGANKRYGIADINNDGRSDFFYTGNYDAGRLLVIQYANPNGYSFRESTHQLGRDNGSKTITDQYYANRSFVADVTGSGINSICLSHFKADNGNVNSPYTNISCEFFSPDTALSYGNKISTFYTPFESISIDYSTLNSFENYSSSESSYPVTEFIAPLSLVSEVRYFSRYYPENSIKYNYQGARTHRLGKGFLGFEEVIETNDYTGIKTITNNSVDINNHYFFKNESIEKRTISGNKLVSRQDNVYNYKSTTSESPLVFFPFISENIVKECELDGKVKNVTKTVIEYDNNYGNPTKITTYKGMNTSSMPFIVENNNYYLDPDTENWIIGLLDFSTVKKVSPDNPNQYRKSSFEYNDLGMLTKEIIEPDSINLKQTKTYIYDYDLRETAYGNIRKTTTTAAGETLERTVETIYDAEGRFVKTIKNNLEHTQHYGHDLWGNVLIFTDANNNTTTYEYDAFGRIKQTNYPDGNITMVRYRWVDLGYYKWTKTTGQTEIKEYYNNINLKIKQTTLGFDGKEILVDFCYDNKFRLTKQSKPYYQGSYPVWIHSFYDNIGRLQKTVENLEGGYDRETDYLYSVVTEMEGNYAQIEKIIRLDDKEVLWTSRKLYNAAGWLVKSYDNLSNAVTYEYHSSGMVKSITTNKEESRKIKMEYDNLGNQKKLIDPDIGVINWTYNGFGELKTKTVNGVQVIINTEYDKLGRLESQQTLEGEVNYTYDNSNAIGFVSEIAMDYTDITGNSVSLLRSFKYDDFGKIIETTDNIDNESFTLKYSYDVYGREKTMEYPSGYQVHNSYTAEGYLKKKYDNQNNTIWEAKSINATGQIEEFTIGGVVNNTHTYNIYTGYLESIYSKNTNNQTLQDISYEWNNLGNLTARSYLNKGLREDFTYDELQRLSTVTLNNTQVTQTMTYDIYGNIITKSDVGTYNYENAQTPNRLTSVTGNPDIISDFMQELKYTSFNKICEAKEDGAVMRLIYNFEHERIIQKLTEKDGFETIKKYIGGGLYEKINTSDGKQKELHYIHTPTGLAAVYTIENNKKEINYVLNDHLGSLHMVLDNRGNVLEENSFDAWGLRRDPNTLQAFTQPQKTKFSFGFTGHEHHELFNLINMNGRVYDPTLGRFLSPDPTIPNPSFTQSLNRYAYCYNSPLSLTDPSGYSAVGEIFGAILQITATAILSTIPGVGPIAAAAIVGFGGGLIGTLVNGGSFKNALIAGVMGMHSALMTAGMANMVGDIGGALIKSGGFMNDIAKMGMHGLVQGSMRAAQGGKFIHGFLSGAVGSLSGSLTANMHSLAARTAISAALGGTAEQLGGGKFANGAITGAYTVMFNHFLHEGDPRTEGKVFSTSDEMVDYMLAISKKEQVETAAFVFEKNGEYLFFVQPWARDEQHLNTRIKSWNFHDYIAKYRNEGYSFFAQIHTHNSIPNNLQGLSPEDLTVMRNNYYPAIYCIEGKNNYYGVKSYHAPLIANRFKNKVTYGGHLTKLPF